MADTRQNTPVTIDGPCFARLHDGQYESATEITLWGGSVLSVVDYCQGVRDIVDAGFAIPDGLLGRVRRTYAGFDVADAIRGSLIGELAPGWRFFDIEGNAISALAPHLWEPMWAAADA